MSWGQVVWDRWVGECGFLCLHEKHCPVTTAYRGRARFLGSQITESCNILSGFFLLLMELRQKIWNLKTREYYHCGLPEWPNNGRNFKHWVIVQRCLWVHSGSFSERSQMFLKGLKAETGHSYTTLPEKISVQCMLILKMMQYWNNGYHQPYSQDNKQTIKC